MTNDTTSKLDSLIRRIPDFPKPGILFYDISSLVLDPVGLRLASDEMMKLARSMEFDKVAAIEARGFIFGSIIAHQLNKGLILLRKKGKLPGGTLSTSYGLEYGKAELEISDCAVVGRSERVLIVDDLLATGGTLAAGAELIRKLGGTPIGALCLIVLSNLPGKDALHPLPVTGLLSYNG